MEWNFQRKSIAPKSAVTRDARGYIFLVKCEKHVQEHVVHVRAGRYKKLIFDPNSSSGAGFQAYCSQFKH